MANRYWVGGTASWDGTAGTKWALTSGGAGGQAVPTSADDVFFDAASTGTCTIATGNTGAKSITCTGFTGTLTGTAAITVSGNITLGAGMTHSYSGVVTVNATSTITSAGKTFGALTVNGAGITVTLGDAFTCGTGRDITVTAGTFDSANFTITARTLSSSNTNVRTISLGSSTVTLQGAVNFSTPTNLTFNAGTSQINCPGTGPSFTSGGQTFYNVTFTNTSLSGVFISGAATFNNLTFTGRTSSGNGPINFDSNITVNGTFTVTASTSAVCRLYFSSDVRGTARTFTCNAVAAIADVNFRDITFAGACVSGGNITGTRLGDMGGNTAITFAAGVNKYWNLAAGGNWSSTGWALSSGAAPAVDNFPLPQDTAIFEATGLNSGATITMDTNWGIGTIDMSARTANTMTLALGTTQMEVMGNWINGTGVTISGSSSIPRFVSRSTQSITSNGVAFGGNLTIDSVSGTLSLVDNCTTLQSVTLTSGTLSLGTRTLTVAGFFSSGTAARTINFGTGNITAVRTSGTAWDTATVTNLTVTGTPVVNVTNSTAGAITVNTGPLSEANSVSFNFTAGTYALTFLGTSGYTAKNVNFTGFAGTWGANNTVTVYGNLETSTGMTLTASAFVMTFGSTSSQTIKTNGKTFDFPITINGVGNTVTLLDNLTLGAARAFTHTNGTLDLSGKTLRVGTTYSTGAGTKNLTFNGGTLVCPNSGATAFNNAAPTGYTTTAGTGTGKISMTSASAKTFVGGGSTFNCTLSNDGAGALTITGSNTFTTLANGVQPTTFSFTAGTTTTVTNWIISGTAGSLVTIGSATAASHTLLKSGGAVNSNYLSISRSRATGGASWDPGANSIDAGNNSGWLFGKFMQLFY